MKKRRKLETWMLIAIASLWAIVCLFPLWTLVSVTFSSDTSNLTNTFLPNSFHNGLAKIQYALNVVNIFKALGDTLMYTGLVLAGMLLVCSLAAYEFTFYQFPGKKLLFALLMSGMMLPLVLYIIPLYRFVFSIGLSDTLPGIALPMMISPLSVFILMQFLEDLPMSFIESARIDGAGHFSIFRYIVLPLLRNGLITATVLMFLKTWGAYLWPSLITASAIRPISVTIASILSPNFYTDPRVKIAAMLISMVPPLLIYLVFQRKVIEGMTMSGIKG